MGEIRLQKYLAECGVASRRKAEELIAMGRVALNGEIVTAPGIKVSPEDIVMVDGKRVFPENEKVYIILNKPKGYVTTVKDQFSRKSVIDLVDTKYRVYPVGRLDYDTSGLIILTNDGDFAYKLTHPSHEVEKVYIAEVKGILGMDGIKRFSRGILIDGYVTAPSKIKLLEKRNGTCVVEIRIHEGRNRQIRKMCEAIGHRVLSLMRVSIGGLELNGLEEGKWRMLNKSEIKMLIDKASGNQ